MEKVKFQQILTPEDLIAYNCYLATKRSKSSLMTRILGLFLIVMGIIDLFRPNPQYVMCVLIILFGVFGLFFMNPLLLKAQKNTIRKKISQNYSDVIMNVTVSEEGFSFEVPKDETESDKKEENYYGEIHTVTPIDSGLEQEDAEQTQETAVEQENIERVDETTIDDENVEDNDKIEETNEISESQESQQNVFSIPWNGITKIVDDGTYMFINMMGYQAMLIKKSAYENIDEIIAYSKEKLGDPKKYKEEIVTPKQDNDETK